jgi:predicted O-linked N-acetylglucosamine transferase (SPINDLY family)
MSLGAMRLWQSILETVPGSRLALRAAFFTSAARIGAYRRRFQEAGVDTKRVDFLPALPHAELLAAYGDIDIALDPSPYSGGITTLEALWMGVPVVTKPGASFPGRHTTSFLQTIGLDEMVAKDETDYIERAVGLAGSPSRLQALRSSLRDKMAASPLTAHARFTGDVESLLRGLWREWCANSLRPAS